MNDFPAFTTEYGVASLILREIPYRGRAYIKVLSSVKPELLLQECVAFCRACGAEWIGASGSDALKKYPCYASLVTLSAPKCAFKPTAAALCPVTEETLPTWLEYYNARMREVPNGAFLDSRAGKNIFQEGGCYFVVENGVPIGLGKLSGDRIDALASLQPGAGKHVVCALASGISCEQVRLTVAKENQKAMYLYQKMGFLPIQEENCWYRVL